MKKKKTKEQTMHNKAIRLIEGGEVSCSGLTFRAHVADCLNYPCYECSVDSACDSNISDLCAECDQIGHQQYYLEIVTQ